MTKSIKEPVDMTRYASSKPVADSCSGCENIIDYVAPEGEFTEEKCRIYASPESMWPRKDVKYLKHTVTVRKRNETGKAVGLEEQTLPIINKICPMATHVSAPEIVATDGKVRAGQQKQSKK